MTRSVDDLLAEARAQIERVEPRQAQADAAEGALLIDIRPIAQRQEHGVIPGALVIERNVLEWRLDPRCDHRLDVASGYDRALIVFCQQGYASGFAAASLRALGHRKVADLIGGFDAWRASGLPHAQLPSSEADRG